MRIQFLGHRFLLLCWVALLLCACASRDAQRLRPLEPVVERGAQTPDTRSAPSALPAPAPASALVPVAPDRAPPEIVVTPLKEATPVSSGAGPHIALILPLASATFASVADAVRQGFVAAAGFEGKNAPPYRIYVADDEADSLSNNFRSALNNGAEMVVAGLTRDGATLLSRLTLQAGKRGLSILALNAPDMSAPDNYYSMSLSLENEARQAAQFAASEGARSVAIIYSSSGLGVRIQDGFEKEWIHLGGAVLARIPFSGDPGEAPGIHAKLANLAVDIVFIAAEPEIARFARPYVPVGMPVYATSFSFDMRADAVTNIDLDGMRFLDMPWFVQPDHPAVMVYPRPAGGASVEQERLYALGVDAWRLASLLIKPDQRNPSIDGVTGRLTLDANHQFLRALTAVEFRDGRVQVYKNNAE
jgi:uncharacterized protein